MCGIAGIIANYPLPDNYEKILRNMLNMQSHRGPDNLGTAKPAENVLLGHNRLSIIDIDRRAHQPLQYENNWIVFNGEIYNYQQLKQQLENDGFTFRTSSDTEVLLASYHKWGVDCVKYMDGMFAFIIYDTTTNKVFIIRDRLGKKPIYYFHSFGIFYFASEVKSLCKIPGISLNLDYQTIYSIDEYLFAEKLSPYREIEELPPGHYIETDLNSFEIKKVEYFSIVDLVDKELYTENKSRSLNELTSQLDDIIHAAVKKRLISDVPVCSINSGGLDSSLISAIVARYQPVELFHVDVRHNSELAYAKKLSQHIKQPFNVISFSHDDFQHFFEATSLALEFPLMQPHNVAIYLLAKFIHEKQFKVVLGGEVADEAGGGYPHFFRSWSRMNAVSSRMVSILSQHSKKYFKRLLKLQHPLLWQKRNWHDLHAIDNILLAKFTRFQDAFQFINDEKEQLFQAYSLFDLTHYVRPLLMRGDKLFMAHSVELRLPFADIYFLRFMINLPVRLKLGKHIIKKVAEKYLPHDIIYRTKMGFPVPFTLSNHSYADSMHPFFLNLNHAVDRASIDIFHKQMHMITN